MNRNPKACYQPTRLIDLDLPPETIAALEAIAAKKGISLEEVVSTAIDRGILREFNSNN
jgi:hypothetical protein